MQKFAERLRSRRNHAGFTPAKLAQLAEISERSLWDYETQKNTPTLEKLERLASALGCSPAWLLGGDAPASAPLLLREEPSPQLDSALARLASVRADLDELHADLLKLRRSVPSKNQAKY